jgi:hypothetical protein
VYSMFGEMRKAELLSETTKGKNIRVNGGIRKASMAANVWEESCTQWTEQLSQSLERDRSCFC